MAKISVARALAEQKLIDKKIEKQLSGAKYCAYKRGKKSETSDGVSVEEFTKNVKSSYESVQKLIKQKNSIKSAIVQSNANTIVRIGEIEMSVAAAIERKRTIVLEQHMLDGMKNDFISTKTMVERNNLQVQTKLDSLLESNFGAGKGGSAKTEEVEAISKPYLENNQVTMIDPIGIDSKIQALESEIDEFVKNVDFALNESNVTTMIDVEL